IARCRRGSLQYAIGGSMLIPVGRAGTAVFTPLLKANDDSAAGDNWNQLNAIIKNAKRFPGAITIQLPPGVFYIAGAGQPIFPLDELARGVTLQGMGSGKTLLVPGSQVNVAPVSLISSRVSYSSTGTLSPSLGQI